MRLLVLFLHLGLAVVADALDLSDPAKAEPELESLVAEWEEAWSREPNRGNATGLATSLQALGVIQRQLGRPRPAIHHLERAASLMDGTRSPLLPDVREALALCHLDLGESGTCEELLRQVLAKRRLDPVDPVPLALTLDHLAQCLLLRGRYLDVAPLLEESLTLLPETHQAERARVLGHLGRLRHTLGSHARALRRFDEALALDFHDPELRLSLRSQRALARLRLGDIDEAMLETHAVAEDARELLAGKPLRAIPYINNLGALELSLGQPEDAARCFREARDLLVSHFGEHHPALAGIHQNLGVALQQAGDLDRAGEELSAAAELQRKYYPDDHLRVAETRRGLAIHAVLTDSPEAPQLAREATAGALRLLERLVEGGTETERLNFIERFDIVNLPCALGDAELIADTLLASKARLLEVLIGGHAGEPPRWRELSASLPAGSAFIDFCRYQPLEPGADHRYGAILLVARAAPRWIELESAPKLQNWLRMMHERLDWNAARLAGRSTPAPSLTLAGTLRGLHQQFWAPIEDLLPDHIRHLVVAPDGAIHFLPIAALVDEQQKLIGHRYDQVTRVASGRDLLESRDLPELNSAPWNVLSISDYPHRDAAESRETPLSLLLDQLGSLPGTREEGRILRRLAPEGSRFLENAEVSEQGIHALPRSPAVLHFGGHAFFLGAEQGPPEVPVDFDRTSQPLAASGLILHQGLRRAPEIPGSDSSDDLLFPAEIARLPLGKTRLVTLSSCDSGAGTAIDGEGILGLQRAFAIAGAREVVVALWPLADRSTPRFMERFYELALRSNQPAQALWQAQVEHLPQPDSPGFEEAVLRFAPFALSQNHAIHIGPPIPSEPDEDFPWLPVLSPLPVVVFGITRWRHARRKKTKIPSGADTN